MVFSLFYRWVNWGGEAGISTQAVASEPFLSYSFVLHYAHPVVGDPHSKCPNTSIHGVRNSSRFHKGEIEAVCFHEVLRKPVNWFVEETGSSVLWHFSWTRFWWLHPRGVPLCPTFFVLIERYRAFNRFKYRLLGKITSWVHVCFLCFFLHVTMTLKVRKLEGSLDIDLDV